MDRKVFWGLFVKGEEKGRKRAQSRWALLSTVPIGIFIWWVAYRIAGF